LLAVAATRWNNRGITWIGYACDQGTTTMPDTMRALVIMGVTGCGKSTVATAICERTGAMLIEGDAFHPEGNVLKMRAGVPLNDDDRQGWLERLGEELARVIATGVPAVLTCSALKRRYRDALRAAVPGLGFVFLQLSPEVAAERVAHRSGHFMPASLVDSQFLDLEPPVGEPGVLVVCAVDPLISIVEKAVAWWQAG
jgi:gluconokinase